MKKSENIYPILGPGIFYSYLNENMALLIDEKRRRTKTLNRFQAKVIELFTGDMSIKDIEDILCASNPQKIKADSIEKFILKLITDKYIHWMPVPIKLKEKSDLTSLLGEKTNFFYPNKLSQVTISVTEDCCLKCSYCSQNARFMHGNSMPKNLVLRLLDESYELGAKSFGVFGGEPLLYESLDDVVEYAYKIGFRDVKIFTKGTLIDGAKARDLKSMGISSVQVSCDSCNPEQFDKIVGEKGTFEQFSKGLYNLISAGIGVDLKIVATKFNIDEIPDMIEYFSSSGVDKILIEVAVPVGRADFSILPESEKVLKLDSFIAQWKDPEGPKVCFKYLRYGIPESCAGGISNLMIFTDGYVAPCDKWYSYRKQFNFGNVYEASLAEIWEKGNYDVFRNVPDYESCLNCKSLIHCRGGCKLHSMILYGDLKHPDIACFNISGKKKGVLFVD